MKNLIWERLCHDDPKIREIAISEYKAWLNDPMTEQVLGGVRDMIDAYLDMQLPLDAAAGNTITSEQRMWKLHGLREAERRLCMMDEDAREVRLSLEARRQSGEINTAHSDFND